jgi:hypothetical protein
MAGIRATLTDWQMEVILTEIRVVVTRFDQEKSKLDICEMSHSIRIYERPAINIFILQIRAETLGPVNFAGDLTSLGKALNMAGE